MENGERILVVVIYMERVLVISREFGDFAFNLYLKSLAFVEI